MNQSYYKPTIYNYPAVFPASAEAPNPVQSQPGPGWQPQPGASPQGFQGYQPVYPPPTFSCHPAQLGAPVQIWQGDYPSSAQAAVYPPPQAAPTFSLLNKDPRKSGSLRRLNLAAVLVMVQTALSFVFPVALSLILTAFRIDLQKDGLGMLWLSAAISPVCTALPCLIYMWAGRLSWSEFFRFEKPGFFTGLLCVFSGLGVCLAGNFPAIALEELLKSIGMSSSAGDVSLNPNHSFSGFLLQFAVVAILVPVMEEFAFRGVLYSSLSRYGTGFAIVGSALVFGMAHLMLPNVVFATIAGLAMGYVYAKTQNLWLTVAIHALNNGISVINENAALLVGESMADVFAEYLMLVPIILGALSLILLIVLCRKKLFGKSQMREVNQAQVMQPLKTGEALACYMKSVALWGLFLIVLGYTAFMFVL